MPVSFLAHYFKNERALCILLRWNARVPTIDRSKNAFPDAMPLLSHENICIKIDRYQRQIHTGCVIDRQWLRERRARHISKTNSVAKPVKFQNMFVAKDPCLLVNIDAFLLYSYSSLRVVQPQLFKASLVQVRLVVVKSTRNPLFYPVSSTWGSYARHMTLSIIYTH